MHYHCEIIMPPVSIEDIPDVISEVLKPFDESNSENSNSFWDFYVIGGRWAGTKLISHYDKNKVDQFWEWLREEGITVSGLQCGKQELNPSFQNQKVDEKWNEMFPSESFVHCPLFNHSNNQYGEGLTSSLPGDIEKLSDVSRDLECNRVIICGKSYSSDSRNWTGPMEARFMLTQTQWNGVNHMKVDWDGKLFTALDKYKESLENYRNEFQVVNSPCG